MIALAFDVENARQATIKKHTNACKHVSWAYFKNGEKINSMPKQGNIHLGKKR